MAESTLGLVMILKNEAHNLNRSLAPVAGLFDEVVVIDTGSTDGTGNLCAELGAKVFDFTWVDDFAAARNYSLDHARADWLFWLDGDNAIEAKDVARLRSAVSGLEAAVLWAQEHVQATGARLWQKRCFPRSPEVRFQGRVHEQLVHPAHWTWIPTPVVVEHWGYQDPDQVLQNGRYYLGLLEMMLAEDPNDHYAHFQAARCLVNLRDFASAEEHLLAMVKSESARLQNRQLHDEGHFLLAQCLVRLGRSREAWDHLEEFARHNPDHGLGHYHLGRLAYRLGEWVHARRHLERALALGLEAPVVDLDPHMTMFRARYFLGRALERLGMTAEALTALEAAHAMEPGNTTVMTDMARLLMSAGMNERARRYLEMVLTIRPQDRSAKRLVGRLEQAA